MTAFKPRAVPPARWRAWALQAFSLVTERWYWHVPLALAVSAGMRPLPRLIRVVLGVAGLLLFALLAHATAERLPLRQVLRAHAGALLRITASWLVALASVVLILVTLMPEAARRGGASPGSTSSSAGDAAASALDFQAGADWLATAALAVAGPGAIFFLAVLLFARAPLLQAIDLAADAVRLNRFVIALGLGLAALLLLAAWWTGLSVVAALPCAGALLQVAYQDVFLGRPPPAQAARKTTAPASPQASPHIAAGG